MKNILLVGVGGQGTVLAAKLIANAALDEGLPVRGTETIGMAQRGGSVVSHVRIGEAPSAENAIKPASPMIPKGGADIIIGFEPGEVVRNLPYLAHGGTVVVAREAIAPVTAALTGDPYDGSEALAYLHACAGVDAGGKSGADDVRRTCTGADASSPATTCIKSGIDGVGCTESKADSNAQPPIGKLVVVDGNAACAECGSAKVLNVVLLGAACKADGLGLDIVQMENAIVQLVKPQFIDMNRKALDIGARLVDVTARGSLRTDGSPTELPCGRNLP